MKPKVRYQAAIIRDGHLLLLKVWDHTFTNQWFWVIPGGGRQPNETEEECVLREVREETHLDVEIHHLLLAEPELPEDMYEHAKTYLCQVRSGVPKPGMEPEVDTAEKRTIQEIEWFDLRDPSSWDPLALRDPILLHKLHRIRTVLRYI